MAQHSFARAAGASDQVDALEDTTDSLLWQWELRDMRSLPKQLRGAAIQHKKFLHAVRAEMPRALKTVKIQLSMLKH